MEILIPLARQHWGNYCVAVMKEWPIRTQRSICDKWFTICDDILAAQNPGLHAVMSLETMRYRERMGRLS